MKTVIESRTNDRWLALLGESEPSRGAVEELRAYIRGALGRVLRKRAGVDEFDLDDFTQDAIVRILEALGHFRGDSRFTTWATAVAIRTAFTALRRRRYADRSVEDLEPWLVEPMPGPGAYGSNPARAASRKDLLEALHNAIHSVLTERQRMAVLGELAGVPTALLAERLETNPNALYKLHHDARKKLKAALESAGYGDEDVRQELQRTS